MGEDDSVVEVSKSQPKKYFQRTKLCRFHSIGACEKGSACNFAHSVKDMQELPNFSKTRLCTAFMATGTCDEGPDCKFAHGHEDIRVRKHFKNRASGPPKAKGKSGNSSKSPQVESSQNESSAEQVDQKVLMMHVATTLYHQKAAIAHLSLAYAATFADWSWSMRQGDQSEPKELKESDGDQASIASKSTHADSRAVSKESLPCLSELGDESLPMRIESDSQLWGDASIEKIMHGDKMPLKIPVALEGEGVEWPVFDTGLITVSDRIPLQIPVAQNVIRF
eukprot:TRINITY_DN19661_c0_g2_i1.p1 TRINITY_DN19661_c0_g2~~TRINITY_DN19661_c0_g2_i1.p1  ORF type:complete len:309 (+),score=68.58 TRINITY_DN19661_c0_g2_i1:90-929(+)